MVRAGSARAGMGRGFARVPQSAKASAGWQRRLSALRHPSNIRLIVLVKCFIVACLQLVPGLVGSPQPSKHRQKGGAGGCCASHVDDGSVRTLTHHHTSRGPEPMVAAPTSFEAPPSSPGSRAHVKIVLRKHEGVKVGAPTYEPISHCGDARSDLASAPGYSVSNEARPQGVLLPAP